MDRDAKRWTGACLPCALRKTRRRMGTTEPGTLSVSYPWSCAAIYLVGLLYETAEGHRWILTIIDCFSKFPIAVPLKNGSAEEVARALFENLIANHSCPRVIVSDNAQNFCGEVMEVLTKLFGIAHVTTVAYTPQLNAYVERFHGWLMATLINRTDRRLEK